MRIPIIRLSIFCALGLYLLPAHFALAHDINLVAMGREKAMFTVNGKPPKSFSLGSIIIEDTRLVALNGNTATIETKGKKEILYLGLVTPKPYDPSKIQTATLFKGDMGHYMADAQINGGSSVRMLVDTGATNVALPGSEAVKLGIDYRKGLPSLTKTANGVTVVFMVKLASIKVGGIEVYNVTASVHEKGLDIGLLGMAFLNEVNMKNDGNSLVLTKR